MKKRPAVRKFAIAKRIDLAVCENDPVMLLERFDIDAQLPGSAKRFVPYLGLRRSIGLVSDRLLYKGQGLVPLARVLLRHSGYELVAGFEIRRKAAGGNDEDQQN